MTPARFELRIDRVVLRDHSLPEHAAAAFRGALETALTDRLSGIVSVRAGLVPAAVMLREPLVIGGPPDIAAGRIADSIAGALRGQATATDASSPQVGTRHG